MRRNPVVERETKRIGHEIFAYARAAEPGLFDPRWWQQQMLEWAMADPWLKTQMFRFIAVLPALSEPRQIAAHLNEYFPANERPLPWPLRVALGGRVPDSSWSRWMAKVVRGRAVQMARRFIAGETPAEALDTVQRLRRRQMAFTLDILGEATISDREAEAYQQRYIELLESLAPAARNWPIIDRLDRGPGGRLLPRVNVSVKLSALDAQFDAIDPAGVMDRVGRRLRAILRRARELDASITLDMEQYRYKELTLHIFRQLLGEPDFRDWPDVGIVLQAYLQDARQDLAELLDWVRRRGTPITLRLVKGAYWDYENVIAAQNDWPAPVFQEKWQSDECFEAMAEVMLQNLDLLGPQFASHNVRSLAFVIATARRLGLDPAAYEAQMLYGMGDPLKSALVELAVRLRVYAPFGELIPGMGYLIRRLLENTANESFLRQGFMEEVPEEALLAAPGPNHSNRVVPGGAASDQG